MPPPRKDKINLLVTHIENIFNQGICLGNDVLHYIDSTLSNPSFSEIAAVLANESHPERDTLLELIFYPDLSMQLSVEKLLDGRSYSQKDLDTVRSSLCKAPLETVVHFADGRGTIPLTPAFHHIDAFLRRLNLTQTIDSRILAGVEKNIPAVDQLLTKVKLRNAHALPVGGGVDLLWRYFEKMVADPLFWEGLDFLLVFLERYNTAPDSCQALVSEKYRLLTTLKKIDTAEAMRQTDNMETLLLRGERFPHADREETLKSIAVIDRIALKIFGISDWTPLPTADVRHFDGVSEYFLFLKNFDL